MDQIKLAMKDVLLARFVTLDMSHLLMSAVNALVYLKAVVFSKFGRRKKKGSDVKWTK